MIWGLSPAVVRRVFIYIHNTHGYYSGLYYIMNASGVCLASANPWRWEGGMRDARRITRIYIYAWSTAVCRPRFSRKSPESVRVHTIKNCTVQWLRVCFIPVYTLQLAHLCYPLQTCGNTGCRCDLPALLYLFIWYDMSIWLCCRAVVYNIVLNVSEKYKVFQWLCYIKRAHNVSQLCARVCLIAVCRSFWLCRIRLASVNVCVSFF